MKKKTALQNKEVGARKAFGTFEKRVPADCTALALPVATLKQNLVT